MAQGWEAKSDLAHVVHNAGFQYDPEQDIIYSRMNAWQRRFGYAYSYDLAAPATISALIDCEPFFFRYNNKDWMIELWKGQYGLETGAEIGVYVNRNGSNLLDKILGDRPHDPANSKLFDCANDSELLEMSFTLYRKGEKMFERGPEKHWWLTGFKWGVLSDAQDLKVELTITFEDLQMRDAFAAAVQDLDYRDLSVNDGSVSFVFDTPRTFQPRTDPDCKVLVDAAGANNSRLVSRYQALNMANNDPNQLPADLAKYFGLFSVKTFINKLARVLLAKGYSKLELFSSIETLFGRKPSRLRIALERFVDSFKRLFQ